MRGRVPLLLFQETKMIKKIAQKIAHYRRTRQAILELSRLSDRELSDLGITRCDIPRIVYELN